MLPLMTKTEIRIIEQILFYFASRKDNSKLEILEWGTGGSTVHYSSCLLGWAANFNWLGIEYNAEWHKTVQEAAPQVEMVLFDVGNTKCKQKFTEMDAYVAYPATLGRKWDIIFVDGRKRRRCLIEASQLLKPGGVVILHDAQREYYHCAFDNFKNWDFLAHKLWIGTQDESIDYSFRES